MSEDSGMFYSQKISEAMSNPIEKIGSDWMLITSGDTAKFNMMTASWGGAGFIWNKPSLFVFVRPNRYTFEFLEKRDVFTVSFFAPEYKKALSFCGSHSGRDFDKAKECSLTPFATTNGGVAFEESALYFECRKTYAQDMSEKCFLDKSALEKWYGADNPMHKMYVAEILSAMAAEK